MATEAQARLRKSKESERRLGKWLIEHDGIDPKWRPGGGLSSSAGRVGHITELQLDCISLTYGAENKQMVVPAVLWGFWRKVVHRAREQGKQPLLRWEPTNEERFVAGVRIPTLHVISEERHADLLAYERLYREKQEAARSTLPSTIQPYTKEAQLARGRSRGRAAKTRR